MAESLRTIDKINLLSEEQLNELADQILDHTKSRFRDANPHLTEAEFAGLLKESREWPDKPIFHGYEPYCKPPLRYGQGEILPSIYRTLTVDQLSQQHITRQTQSMCVIECYTAYTGTI
jgi:hypothetical protein